MLDQLQNVFASFQKNDVKYLVIGGIAAVLYGVPRATFDLDVLIEPTPQNAERLLKAMIDAGLGTASLTSVEDLLSTEITILLTEFDWMYKHLLRELFSRRRGHGA